MDFHEIFHEVFLHGILDTLKIIPFLFLTYLLMEFIEHKASEKTRATVKGAGRLGPLVGGALGAVPQCGFPSVAANLFCTRVASVGTLIAVFLSSSDEMLPILISHAFPAKTILGILAYKIVVAVIIGFAVDLVLRRLWGEEPPIDIDELCENDGCHCERGIFLSALHHTASIGVFVLFITLVINALIYFVGSENLALIMNGAPVLSHLIAALFGLIPNCAASVALAGFFAEGIISLGTMLSGLFSGAGVGLAVLFRVNKRIKENLLIVALLVFSGFIFGLISDITGFSALIS